MGKLVQLRLLGPFDARDRHGGPVAISARKNRALLALLALSPAGPMPRARLAGFLWSERPDAQARANLWQALADLRRDLGAVGTPSVLADDEHVWIDLGLTDIDVRLFLDLSR